MEYPGNYDRLGTAVFSQNLHDFHGMSDIGYISPFPRLSGVFPGGKGYGFMDGITGAQRLPL
jgi:hypothetical protein